MARSTYSVEALTLSNAHQPVWLRIIPFRAEFRRVVLPESTKRSARHGSICQIESACMTDDSKRVPPTSGQSTSPDGSESQPGSSGSGADFGTFVSDASRRWKNRENPESTGHESDPTQSNAQNPEGGLGTPPPSSPRKGKPPFQFGRNSALLALVVLLLLLGSFAAVTQFNDSPDPESTLEPTISSTDIVVPSTETPLPTITPSTEILPTNTPAPSPEPTLDVEVSELARQCDERCLVRVAATERAITLMGSTGNRASHQTTDWIWMVATRESIATLDLEGESVSLISNSPETLYLYVATLPEGQSDFAVLTGFGDVLDSIDRSAIVQVAQIPAQVRGVTDAGVDILKLSPAPAVQVSDESLLEITVDDIYGLAAEVDTDGVTTSIVDLQGSSSTDGTGIGSRQYLQPGNVMSAEYLFLRLEAYGMSVRYEDFISPEGTLTSNVIAELPGRDPTSIYGLLAHFDSTSEQFSNAPGADDNATGVAASLEIARILSQYDLEHPVHIIFVNAEETGIIGSRVFARNAVAAGVPYEGIFNLDSIGSARNGQQFWLNSDVNSEWMMALMIRVNDTYGLGQTIQARINPAIVADDNRLRDEGLESILIARELYGTSPYHHTSEDTIDNVSIPYTVSATQLMLLTMASLVVG